MISVLRISLLIVLLCGCQEHSDLPSISYADDGTSLFSGQAMTMQYRIIIGDPIDNAKLNSISKIIEDTFKEINDIHNKWNPQSELSKLNRLPANQKVPLSPSLYNLLLLTDDVYKLSLGKFDPTIEPLQKLWVQKLKNNLKPSPEELLALSYSIGWKKIHIDGGVFYKDVDGLQLDLGGIAKGLCIDLINERFQKTGLSHFYIEWGGEIAARGNHPLGRPWTIYISRMGNTDPDQAIANVELRNQAIATSGDYLQNWTIKESMDLSKSTTTFFHIFDPVSLNPLIATHTSIASASILADSCAFADALATAAMMFPNIEEAEKWLQEVQKEYPEVTYWLASRKLHD